MSYFSYHVENQCLTTGNCSTPSSPLCNVRDSSTSSSSIASGPKGGLTVAAVEAATKLWSHSAKSGFFSASDISGNAESASLKTPAAGRLFVTFCCLNRYESARNAAFPMSSSSRLCFLASSSVSFAISRSSASESTTSSPSSIVARMRRPRSAPNTFTESSRKALNRILLSFPFRASTTSR